MKQTQMHSTGGLQLDDKLLGVLKTQLFAGGFVLMLAGGVMAIMKDLPAKLFKLLERQFTASMKITDDSSSAFQGVAHWLQQQKFFGRVRHADARKFKNEANEDGVAFIPAPGTHWFLYNGWRPAWFSFERTEAKASGGWCATSRYNENFTLGILGRNKAILKQIVSEAAMSLNKASNGASLKVYNDYYWKTVQGYKPRTLDSVILPKDEKAALVADIEKFLRNETAYSLSGTPYRRGYMFYGLPGTGKTSVIAGLSNYFKRNLYVVQPQHMTDEQLAAAIGDIPCHSVVVIEDVDCITAARQTTKKGKKVKEEKKHVGVTLSGLLNCLDGLKVPHGLLFFLTTNCPEKLDAAMVRPGRVDFKLGFTWATKEQKSEYFRKFLKSPAPADILNNKVTMADVQKRALEVYNAPATQASSDANNL
jgi:chaperone BCS1